ncbi:MAG: hypothetical protein AB7I30_14735 [Isosphaeraceae bacterium]
MPSASDRTTISPAPSRAVEYLREPLSDAERENDWQLAERMRDRGWKAGVKAAWVTGDAVYGRRRRGPPPPDVGVQRSAVRPGGPGVARGQRGAGSKGPRRYEWAAESLFGSVDGRGGRLWPLVQRLRLRSDERADHLCLDPVETP